MNPLSRREFVGRAAAMAAALTLPIDVRPVAASSLGDPAPLCALLATDGDDSLAESVAGFESALAEAGVPFTRSLVSHDVEVVIVPGAVRISRRTARQLTNALDAGATVVLESGAVFGAANSRELRDHRDMLRDLFDLEIDPPASLWPAHGIPYVEYTWPVIVRVRDFSRVVPVRHHNGEVIGRAAGLPVAIHRCQGRGSLIFLGSPLGPALWSGDAQARGWLGAVIGGGRGAAGGG